MHAQDRRMIERQPLDRERPGPEQPQPVGARLSTNRELEARRNLFLNAHLNSQSSSLSNESSISGSNSEAEDSFERIALLEDSPLPQPNIAALYRTLYDYLRYLVVLGLFVYSFFMIFSVKGNCHNGSGAIKKLPPVSSFS